MEADQYRNRIVLFEKYGWFRSLEKAVAKNETADALEAIRKVFLMMTESRAVLENAVLSRDKNAMFSAARVIAEDATRIVLLVNRTYVATTGWFWKMAFETAEKLRGFRVLVERACGFTPRTLGEAVEASKKLYFEIFKMVDSRGIKIERADLWV
jgi:KNTase-like protein